jgi:hypothetical protein
MTMKKLGKGCLVVVGVFVVLVMLGALFGRPTASNPNISAPTTGIVGQAVANNATAIPAQPTAAPEPPTAAPKAMAIGDDVLVDEMRWKILSAEDLGNTLKSDNTYIKDLKTSGRFVKVRFEMENRSKHLLSYAGLDLVDSQDRSFKNANNALQFIPQDELCVFENLNPNIVKTCTVIYEIPANASRLHAEVTGLTFLGSAKELVDLGLTLK